MISRYFALISVARSYSNCPRRNPFAHGFYPIRACVLSVNSPMNIIWCEAVNLWFNQSAYSLNSRKAVFVRASLLELFSLMDTFH